MAHALLNQRVPKTEHFNQSSRRSVTGKIFCVIASLLLSGSFLLRAGEPVLTLAMNRPAEENFALSSMNSKPDAESPVLNLKNSRNQTMAAAVSDDSLEQPGSFSLVREDSHPSSPVTIRAGYGRIWDDQSTLQKISIGHQEPSCAYVSANFNF